MRPRFMSSTGPNLQRIFSQKSFEESLQVLTQLSSADESHSTAQENPSLEKICWDEVAQDLEDFLLQGLDAAEVTIETIETIEEVVASDLPNPEPTAHAAHMPTASNTEQESCSTFTKQSTKNNPKNNK